MKRKRIIADTAPPERWQHDVLEKDRDGKPKIHETPSPIDARAGVMVQHVRTQDALDRYWARGELASKPDDNARLYEAGKRLRDAWQHSGLECLVSGGYQPGVDGYRDPDLRMVLAMDRSRAYGRLIVLVPIPCQWWVMTACCAGLRVGKDKMDLLRLGLTCLADALEL